MKKIKMLLVVFAFIFTFAMQVFAGTGVIQFGDPTVTRDKTFNLTMKVKSTDVRLKTADISISYNPTMIEFISGTNAEGGAGTVKISGTGEGKSSGTKTLEYILKFKALYAGKTEVTISTQEVTDNTGNLVNITKLGTSAINIKPTNTQSKNANLTTLDFSPGELDRTFDPSVLNYNTEVNADVDSLAINAIPEDKDARTKITGNENFNTGINKVTIEVTAPDNKTKKSYVIAVTKLETGVTSGATTIVNGQKLASNKYTITIMIKPDDVSIPSGYERLQGEMAGQTIDAYGPTGGEPGVTPEVFLVYGMNEDGIIDFYRVDTRDNTRTIQRFSQDDSGRNYDALVAKYNQDISSANEDIRKLKILIPVSIGLLALVVILIVVVIIMIMKNPGGKMPKNKYDFDDNDDDDDFFVDKRPINERKEEESSTTTTTKVSDENDDIVDLG